MTEYKGNNQHSKNASLYSVVSINVTAVLGIALSFDIIIHLGLMDKYLVLVDFMPVREWFNTF